MRPLDGQTNGLKASQLKRLQATFRRKVKGDALVTLELARHLADLAANVGQHVVSIPEDVGPLEKKVQRLRVSPRTINIEQSTMVKMRDHLRAHNTLNYKVFGRNNGNDAAAERC